MQLTADDRLDILDAYGRYCIDFDGGNAAGAAARFTEDGRFVYTGSRTFEGRDAIASLFARRHTAAPGIRHVVSNIVLDPTPEGAVGRAYVVVLRLGTGEPLRVVTIGQYDDVWIKLGDGWRMKQRTYTEWLDASLIDAPLTAAPSAGA